jgi:hypothetical protein
MTNEFTEKMVRNVILTWYSGTNEHRPVAEIETMLSEDVQMKYPDQPEPLIGKAGFREWYANVLKKYFDETHEVESWNITIDGNQATVTVIVRWEARSWPVGVARSKYEAFLTRQHFMLQRSVENGEVLIREKIAETFEKTAPLYEVGA